MKRIIILLTLALVVILSGCETKKTTIYFIDANSGNVTIITEEYESRNIEPTEINSLIQARIENNYVSGIVIINTESEIGIFPYQNSDYSSEELEKEYISEKDSLVKDFTKNNIDIFWYEKEENEFEIDVVKYPINIYAGNFFSTESCIESTGYNVGVYDNYGEYLFKNLIFTEISEMCLVSDGLSTIETKVDFMEINISFTDIHISFLIPVKLIGGFIEVSAYPENQSNHSFYDNPIRLNLEIYPFED